MTAFRSQSRTAHHVIVAGTNMDARSFYTALSRGRFGCDLFTPDFKLFKEQMKESIPRQCATDLILQAPTWEEKLKASQVRFQEYLRKANEILKEPAQPFAERVQSLATHTRDTWKQDLPINRPPPHRSAYNAHVQITGQPHHGYSRI